MSSKSRTYYKRMHDLAGGDGWVERYQAGAHERKAARIMMEKVAEEKVAADKKAAEEAEEIEDDEEESPEDREERARDHKVNDMITEYKERDL